VLLSACGKSNGVDASDEFTPSPSSEATTEADATASPEATSSTYKYTYYGKDYDEIEYDVLDYVKLGQYKGINVTTSVKNEVSDSDMNSYILDIFSETPIDIPISRKTIKKNDYLRVTRDGETDSELFSVAESGSANIKLLKKAKVGDTVTITNPSDNSTTYTFKINSVVDYHTLTDVSEITDDYLTSNSSFTSVSDMKKKVKRYLEGSNMNTLSGDCVSVVISNSEIKIPKGLLKYYMNIELASIDKTAGEAESESLDSYLQLVQGVTLKEYKRTLKKSLQSWIKQQLICEAIQEKENLKDSDSEYNEYCELVAKIQGYESGDALLEALGGTDSLKEDYSKTFKQLNFIMKNANITYKKK
jgi:trigger factor